MLLLTNLSKKTFSNDTELMAKNISSILVAQCKLVTNFLAAVINKFHLESLFAVFSYLLINSRLQFST